MIKKILLTCLMALVAFAAPAQEKQLPKNVVTTTFAVNIRCKNCAQRIQKSVKQFGKGLKGMKISVKKRQVTIAYDTTKTNVAHLNQAFKALHFKSAAIDGYNCKICPRSGKKCDGGEVYRGMKPCTGKCEDHKNGNCNDGKGECNDAKNHNSKAKSHCDKAKGHCDKAKSHCDKAKSHCDKAKSHCDKAKGHCDKAKRHCKEAKGHC